MQRVLLVGLMATGKTAVAGALSALTGWPELDNDLVLERLTGCTAAQLLEREGSDRLRAAESRALTLTLSMPAPLVAGVAAGVVLDAQDRDRLLAGGHVVWLRAPTAVLMRRLGRASHRPFLDEDPATALQAMADERDPLFEQVAHQVVETDRTTPQEAARLIAAAVRD